ncbi:MAG: lipoyl(octanoyl) transferase LipB [Sedimentisphaerales bacterium]|nr:lipoyl(octanoyl) transferase LipB [Sedimentisphaerales bacterium]
MLKGSINIIDCGIKDYRSALDIQENTIQKILTGTGQDTIFITEHPPTITLGARESANKLLKDTETIKRSGIEIFKIRRGGGATAHNPGQIVIYPVIKLKNHSLGVSDFVALLEKIGIEFLAALSVKSETKKGLPGLWTNNRKIASIGLQVKKWITFHGMAININNDLSIFDLLVPCGLENIQMTSAEKELGKKIDIKTAKNILKSILLKYIENKNEPDYQKTIAQLA